MPEKTDDKSGCDKSKHAQTVCYYKIFIKQQLSKVQIQGKDSWVVGIQPKGNITQTGYIPFFLGYGLYSVWVVFHLGCIPYTRILTFINAVNQHLELSIFIHVTRNIN